MEPTNDLELLREYQGTCWEMCPKCSRSICLSKIHQDWTCRCGHGRLHHLRVQDFYDGPPGHKHPHPCHVEECSCEALWYMTEVDMISNEDAILGLVGFIEDLR